MVRAEAVTIAAVGALLGIGIGTAFAWAAARALENSSSPTLFALPLGTLGAYAVAAVVAGVVAAVLPARWASGIDVLDAIGTE